MNAYSAKAKARRESSITNQQDTTPSSTASTSKQTSKVRRLSNIEVSEFMVKNDIKAEPQLLAIAKERHAQGEKDLYQFIVNKSSKVLSELIEKTWRIQHAPDLLRRENPPRIDKLKNVLDDSCISQCDGQWLICAKEVLKNNGHNVYVFAASIRNALIKGRQKNNNIMLVGPTNCGKSFLLNPLELIYKTFVNPATGKYAWVGVDECELAYLNDFRWSSEIIAWNDLLLLLEGQTIHLSRPKNIYATDLCVSRENTLPIFATSKTPIEFIGRYNSRDDRETDMMATRWNLFTFQKQIPIKDSKQIPPCPHCFSLLVMSGTLKPVKQYYKSWHKVSNVT